MKNFFTKVWQFFEELGKARAAGYLVRQGRHEEALNIMKGEKII